MQSFLQRIKGLTAAKQTALTKPSVPDIQLDILAWKKEQSKDNTEKVLRYLKPTILSALHTYVPGLLQLYRIKATSFALQSLAGYDPAKKVAPSTYVFSNLQRLSRIKRDRLNIVHIPLSKVYLKMKLDKAVSKFMDMYDRLPSEQLLSDMLHVSVKKLKKMQLDMPAATTTLSANVNSITGQSRFSLKDTTDDDYFDYVYKSVSPVDQLIMQYTTGKGKPVLSNNLIAAKLKMSPGAVSQHKAKLQSLLTLVRGLL